MLLKLCDSEPLPVAAHSRLYSVWSINIKPCLDLCDTQRSCPGSLWNASCRTAYHLFYLKRVTLHPTCENYCKFTSSCPLVPVFFYFFIYLMRIWAAPSPVFITRHLLILSHSWTFPHSNISILHYFISWVTDFIRIHVSHVFISPELFTLLHMSVFLYNVHINSILLRPNEWITRINL